MAKTPHLSRDFFTQRAETFDRLDWFNDDALNTWIAGHLVRYGASICDVGSGTGIITAHLLEAGFSEVILTEPSEEMCRQIRQKKFPQSVSLFQLPAERLREMDRMVDVTVSKNSFHHFLDHDLSLRNMVATSKIAVAIVEVIVPDDRCREYVTELVSRKEIGRSFTTIYSVRDLETYINLHADCTRTLICDQYIQIESWLENSDLSAQEKQKLLDLVDDQPRDIKKIMQIHKHRGKTYQLRRIAMVVGMVNETRQGVALT